ncbi:AMP-binding protein [Marinicella sp. W31]|uniref:AMP-binding protein n=1 Tax=Marinicella sp. W31 TaxID=3023713 RepID=UPI0037575776
MAIEKPWLKNYQAGVPEFIRELEYKSVADLLIKSCEKYGNRTAFDNFGKSLSFDELNEQSKKLAALLQDKMNTGDTVAIMMPNVLQYPISIVGILRAGMTVTNVNPLYTPTELKHQLNDSKAKAIIVIENTAATLQEIVKDTGVELIITSTIGELLGAVKGTLINFVLKRIKKMVPPFDLPGSISFKQALQQGSGLTYRPVNINLDDIAFLQYTGGTTGVSKGAMLTNRNIVSNVTQSDHWIGHMLEENQETVITALPLYHIFALTANFMLFTLYGARNVLITNPRDMPGFVKELSKYKFTVMTGVNTLFNGLLNTPGFAELDFSEFKFTLGGGMAVQKDTATRWQEVTGSTLAEAYGLTETSPAACMNPLPLDKYNGTIGLPISSTECQILDEDNNVVPVGEAGELCIRGPQVMKGYLNRPEETASSLVDGWFKTGDIAVMDEEGYFKIVDRKKDMILVSGFNVYPNEIEDAACLHPNVIEAAAIGIEDPKSGEIVKLFLVVKDSMSKEDIISHCREHLTGYKVPKIIEFKDELPKSNVGKILRKDLRE